ncbi:YicC family protein [Candidatus Babeliales bacterium]|nr:YicC family protein [Candidatus Babeliales bacterium]
MLLSMTGYSSGVLDLTIAKGRIVSISIEIKTLNSRFFELTARLSRNLSFLETDIHTLLRKKLIRGRIYCSILPTTGEGELGTVIPSIKTAQDYVRASEDIKKKCKISGELTISDLVNLPNVFEAEKPAITETIKKALLKKVVEVAEKLTKQRSIEGSNLKKDIEKRFLLCKKSLDKISIIYEKLMEEHKKIISKTSQLAEAGSEEARSRLEDLYVMLNKIDIHEEIIRFKSHLEGSKFLIKNREIEKGKRLDFTLQELVRETNTIAAKCSNAEISRYAVDIKVELEKVREQTQNVL